MTPAQKLAAGSVRDHPLVTKLNHSIALDDADLTALGRLLERRVVVKKAKDIIVEGYKYRVLHIVERGFAIRYKLLHSGKRQIVNVIMPGDIIGFPACFYEHAVFSVTALGDMSLHHVALDAFADLAWREPRSRRRSSGSPRVRPRYTPSTSLTRDAASPSRDSLISFWRC